MAMGPLFVLFGWTFLVVVLALLSVPFLDLSRWPVTVRNVLVFTAGSLAGSVVGLLVLLGVAAACDLQAGGLPVLLWFLALVPTSGYAAMAVQDWINRL